MQIRERRGAGRMQLSSKGYALLDNNDIDLTTRDISLEGALVEFAAPCRLSAGMTIRVSLDFGFIGQATVCHAMADTTTLCGLKFERFDHASHIMLGNSILQHKGAA